MSERPPYFILKEPHDNIIREIPHMIQLWFQDCLIRKATLYRTFIGKDEEQLDEEQIASYPYSEFKYWKKFGYTPPTGLQYHNNHFSIIELIDTFSPNDGIAIVDYRVTYEYQTEVDGEWTAAEWNNRCYIDSIAIGSNWNI